MIYHFLGPMSPGGADSGTCLGRQDLSSSVLIRWMYEADCSKFISSRDDELAVGIRTALTKSTRLGIDELELLYSPMKLVSWLSRNPTLRLRLQATSMPPLI